MTARGIPELFNSYAISANLPGCYEISSDMCIEIHDLRDDIMAWLATRAGDDCWNWFSKLSRPSAFTRPRINLLHSPTGAHFRSVAKMAAGPARTRIACKIDPPVSLRWIYPATSLVRLGSTPRYFEASNHVIDFRAFNPPTKTEHRSIMLLCPSPAIGPHSPSPESGAGPRWYHARSTSSPLNNKQPNRDAPVPGCAPT
ncbi:hypothetical protein B0J17DRAFT_634156 [Rhizoctonia solani]|nr:hypothetical protein B0J17DRAFT_634156 [Rhizoctonia solani]